MIILHPNAHIVESTMLSPWSDMELILPPQWITGLLKTHGVKIGVNLDISESEEEMVPAV